MKKRIIPFLLLTFVLSEKDYLVQAPKFFQFLFYTAFRSQQNYPYPTAGEEEAKESEALGDKGLSSMAAVLSCAPGKLQDMVSEMNKELPADKQLYVSLFINYCFSYIF